MRLSIPAAALTIVATTVVATLGVAAAQAQNPAPPAQQQAPDNSAFVNGALNVPGAPTDSQTVPAKFSARNATLDKLPTNATPLWLNDEQRAKIAATLRAGNTPAASTDAHLADPIPPTVELRDLPDGLKQEIPNLDKLKYVRASDRVLLIDPPVRTVVAEIKE